MPQVQKAEVRARIVDGARRLFATHGYAATGMSAVAAEAGTAVGNLYRYFPTKDALFEAAVPATLIDQHDRLLDERLATLSGPDAARSVAAAVELLDFWVEHRHALVILLERAEGTPYAAYPDRFVRRLIDHARDQLGETEEVHEVVLQIVFDNTRRAIARLLAATDDRERLTQLVAGFWSYQLPGLDGLSTWVRATSTST